MDNNLREANTLPLTTDSPQTINSLALAELCGKHHHHLMRSIRKMEEAWVNLNQSKFGLVDYTDEKGELRPMYVLTKTECLYIGSKFKDEARAKLVLRWEELEREACQPEKDITMEMVNKWFDPNFEDPYLKAIRGH